MTESRDMIYQLVREKSVLKQDVFHNTIRLFRELKTVLNETVEDIRKNFGTADKRVDFSYKEKGDFQSEIKIAGDVLVYCMNTNVYQFDKSHSLWRSGYVKDDEKNSYVGIINVYNFLADSFRYQRTADIGYLIARICVNHENHFIVQGKRQLGYLYNDFISGVLDKKQLEAIVNSTILYTLDFDMYTPPYEKIQEITVEDIQTLSQHSGLSVGKRMGFRFGLDDSGI